MKTKILFILSLFFVGNSYSQYCAAGPTSAADSNVESVSLLGATTNISQTGCPGITGAQDLTAQVADVIAGSSYTVDVQFGTCGGNYAGAGAVWIDYNQDDVFQATESVGTWSGTPSATLPLSSFAFSVPALAINGNTRMRVMQQESGGLPLDPCGTYLWGSVMDFTISVSGGFTITCPAPTAVSVTAIGATTATVNWATGGASVWLVEHGPAGFTPGTGTLSIAPTFSLTGLSAASSYDVYVADLCAVGDTSAFRGPINFATTFLIPDGVACVTGGTSILFSEDFEGATSTTPTGWTGAFGGNAQWDVTVPNANSSSTGPNISVSGAQHMEFEGSGTGTALAVTPAINLMGANDEVELSFYMHAFGVEMGTFNVNVGTSPAGPFTSVFTQVGPYQTTATQAWEHVAVDLTAYIGQIIYLQFENTNTITWEADMSIDLIEVRSCVTCPAPTAVTTSAITSSSVDLSWTTGGASVWVVEYGPTGFTPGSGDSTILAIAPSLTISGLNSATGYDFYVQDFCAVGDSSLPVGPVAASTSFLIPDGVACITGASSILFAEDFETTAVSGTPVGWTGDFGSFNAWEVTPANQNSFNTGPNVNASGTQHLEFQAGTNSTFSVVSPAINLTTANDEVEMSFYMHAFGTGMGTFNINVSNSPAGPFAPVFTYAGDYQTTANDPWEHVAVDLTAYVGQIIYVQFTNTSSTFLGDIAIDLFEVRSCVTCPAPTAVSSANITATTVDLSWTTGGASVWLVEYGPAGFTPGMGDSTILAIAPSLTVTGLSAATEYDFYVSDLCLVGDTSIGVGVFGLTTDFLTPDGVICTTGATSVIYAEDFESTAVSGTPSGWIGNFGSFNAWEVTPASQNSTGTGPNISVSGNQHLEFQAGTNTTFAVVSPAINLTTSNDEVELSFYMHAFGTGMGTFTMNISNSQSGPFSPIFTYSGQLQTSATQAWEHIAVDLTAYIGQVVYVQFTNTSLNFRGDVAIDLFEVRSCLTCPAPFDILTSGVTENSVDLAWTTGGAFAWVLEYGPAGFTPGNGDTTVTVVTNPYTLTGLNASTVYDVYVSDLCGLGDTSFAAGPGRFATDCDTVMAPYYQSFDFDLADPHCWSSAGSDPWLYRNSFGGAGAAPNGGVANSVDHTSGIGNYAWIDASGFPGINTNELNSPVIDYSGLTQGIVGCWVKSNNTNGNIQNQIQIEGWNGVTWDSIINYSGNFDGWRRVYAQIPASLPTTTSFRIVQIEDLISTGSTFNNDILVDDFFVEEAPTCLNPTMLNDSIISPTLVELSWTTGGAADWIIEYGPVGFLPGTGAGTLINTNQNPYVLPVNSGQDYDWYVQDSCGPTDISWHSYVENFRMPGEVICGDTVINFTYCHPDETVELFTYQSDNSTSFLHLVFNSGVIANFVDLVIYDGPNDTYPVLFSSTGGENVTGLDLVTSGPFVAFSYNSVFANGCTTPLDFDINCCVTTNYSQVINICVDSTYTLPDGVVVNSEAAYYSTIPNVRGCDSLITTVINILEDSTSVTDIICAGTSYLLPNGVTTFSDGNYQMVVSNQLGCDSAIDMTLILAQPSSSTRNVSICAGSSFEMPNGTFVSSPGVHNLIYGNEAGCDSTYSVNLSINPLTTSIATPVVICEGNSHTLIDGVVVTTSGSYTSHTLNLNGCDETVTTVVTVATSSTFQDTVEICEQETYTLLNGDVIDEAGEYNVNVDNAAGCDSIVTIFVSKCIASGITGEEGNAVASIFPNPSSSMINVTFNTEVINSNIDVKVMNALGQEVDFIKNISETSIVINVSTYSNGMYYLVVNNEKNTSIKKFVVSK